MILPNCFDKTNRNDILLTGIRSLKLPGPGAVAHMSLHLHLTMSKSHSTKEADDRCSPIFLPGDLVSVYVGDQATLPKKQCAALVEPVYGRSEIRSTAFCNFISIFFEICRQARKCDISRSSKTAR